MDTLDALRAGTLQGARQLDLACGLTEFPPEIFALADSLEVLNLSNNQLTTLPPDLGRLKRLKIAFFSNNRFDHLPESLSQCPQLSMIGFKANQIEAISDRALPPKLRWLILTNNQIEQLPPSLGQRSHLQKLMLAGNRLRSLPDLSSCHRLELIRLSANRLNALPGWLFQLPRLAWLAYAGNPCCSSIALQKAPPTIDWRDLTPGQVLGEGTSGTIVEGKWCGTDGPILVAIKLFKDQVTSDGLPADEMWACMAAGSHPHLITAVGHIINHPEGKAGLVLPLISPEYVALGTPPSLETCTRDTYPAETRFTLPQVLHIATDIAAAGTHLHRLGILHGDLYAHNILVNPEGGSLLGDFGAASPYTLISGDARLEQLEVRAFGYLLEEMLNRVPPDGEPPHALALLRALHQDCTFATPAHRPQFEVISARLADVRADVS